MKCGILHVYCETILESCFEMASKRGEMMSVYCVLSKSVWRLSIGNLKIRFKDFKGLGNTFWRPRETVWDALEDGIGSPQSD